MYNFVKSLDSKFTLGSMICKICQIKINKLKAELQLKNEDDTIADPDFAPSLPIVDVDDKLNRREKLDSLTNIFGIGRVRYQVNSAIEQMSEGSLNYFRSVHQQFQSTLTDTFCRLVAPEQEQQMKRVLECQQKLESDQLLLHLKEAFESCTTRKARLSILMLIPKTFSKLKICELFGCSFYEVERARSITKLYGSCGVEPKQERIYSRLSFQKAQHFINFLFSTGLLQEVAYGTTKLKLDSGDTITVANTILNGIYEHAVKQYIIHCKEVNYAPLGRSTLRNILEKMKAHSRKKLAGVDAFVVEGIEAFEVSRRFLETENNKHPFKVGN